MKLWIARDKDGYLCLYGKKPKLSEEIEGNWVCSQYDDPVNIIILPFEYFPEVTFENSPQQVEISLLGKLENKPIKANYILAEGDTIVDGGGLSERYCKEEPKDYHSEIEVKEVITKVDTKKYKHFKSIEFDGKIYESFDNNNYFYNEVDNCLILEICNEERTMYYYEVTKDDLVYLGLVDNVFGIFSEYFESVDGIVELNSSYC